MSPAAEPLGRYRTMRDFSSTPEPAGVKMHPTAHGRPRFVVQRHRARRLHYDLRLEIDGVLASWAVPKGPTLDPKARRLAVHVEDHPFEYGWFEGIIPSGYGQGDVIVWDDGTWESEKEDPAAAIRDGELTFALHGHRLNGRFALVRTKGKDGSDDSWLLLHRADDHAVPGWDAEDVSTSVLSGRTNDDVAANHPPTWEPPTADELAALADARAKGTQKATWTVGGHELRLTNLDKVLIPGRGERPDVTKRDLIRYYASMAPVLAPYLAGRPVNASRYPDGIDAHVIFQRALPDHAPEWVRRWPNPLAAPSEAQEYLMLDGAASLAWAANFGVIELHPWTSTAAASTRPSYALIDIDPGPATSWDDTLDLARLMRTAVEHLQLVARAKVTGKRGIQVWIPVDSHYSFDETHAVVEFISRSVGRAAPELVSWKWHTGDREGKARLDHTQNAINKTLVAPYSVRAAAGAPVSMPIEWDELEDPALRPDRWSMHDVPARLAAAGDPFLAVVGVRQDLPEVSVGTGS